MKIRCALLFSTLFLLTTISIAQTAGGANAFSMSTLSGGINLRSIAAAPFSADVVKESTQALADGTHVRIETHGKMFRDSEGRTRSETEIASAAGVPTRRYVTIVDPVEHVSIILDSQTKTATISALAASTANPSTRRASAAMDHVAGKSQAVVGSQELEASMIEGFAVTGSRRMRPAEAVRQGEKPRSIVVETWFSPELKIELQAKTEDPKIGEVTTKLLNIVMAEPDRSLFETPADYTIKNLSTTSKREN